LVLIEILGAHLESGQKDKDEELGEDKDMECRMITTLDFSTFTFGSLVSVLYTNSYNTK
jgi:hypothetical protein